MKLEDLTKRVSQMTSAELEDFVQQMRHNKFVARPAKVKREEEVEKKIKRKKATALESLLDGMSDEQKAALIAQLTSGEQP